MDRQSDPGHQNGWQVGLPGRNRSDEPSCELGLSASERSPL